MQIRFALRHGMTTSSELNSLHTSMIPEIQRIAQLQLEYSSENTPAMQERGNIIRHDLPALLRSHMALFQASLGRFAESLRIEGRDGIGRKTEAPWVRLYSEDLSPSATSGFYVVIHFALDGQRFFVTVGCGASKWDSERGDLVKNSDEELGRKVAWAKNVLSAAGVATSEFPDQIALGASNSLPRSFEKATILAKALSPETIGLDELVDTICKSLRILSVIYEAFTQRSDISSSESNNLDLQSAVNPGKSKLGQRQGYGLSSSERRAVELHAMCITRKHLEELGYKVTDTSANSSFDFLAELNGEAIKVEVKGTTSVEVDSILMTSNEVALHTKEAGMTALAIVSGIVLTERGKNAACTGGTLEFLLPWDISQWTLTPKAFAVTRPKNTLENNQIS